MRLKKRSEKIEIARPKRRHRKRKKGGGKRLNKKIRSPLHLAWKQALARKANVQACEVQRNQEFRKKSRGFAKFQGISRKEKRANRNSSGRFSYHSFDCERIFLITESACARSCCFILCPYTRFNEPFNLETRPEFSEFSSGRVKDS